MELTRSSEKKRHCDFEESAAFDSPSLPMSGRSRRIQLNAIQERRISARHAVALMAAVELFSTKTVVQNIFTFCHNVENDVTVTLLSGIFEFGLVFSLKRREPFHLVKYARWIQLDA